MAVAQFGNFAKASRTLNIPVSILSKRVARLEDQLGVRLFQRSTRVVTLTDEGHSLLPKIKTLFDDLNEIENTFSENKNLSGIVRMTCVPFVAHSLILPLLKKFKQVHPSIKVEISLGEQIVNIIETNIDLAIRIETPKSTELIYRKLAPNDLVLCASPKYLNHKGKPTQIEDLSKHDLLFLKIHESVKFVDSNIELKEFRNQKYIESDSGAFLTDLALNDCGILARSIWDVKGHIEGGRLIQVLKRNPLETFGHIHVVIPSKKFLAPRSRALYEFILEESENWQKGK